MDQRAGMAYGLTAYGLWGLAPFYFRSVGHVPAGELLAHRVLWSAILLAAILGVTGRFGDLRRCFASPAAMRSLAGSTVLIALNWLTYIWAVTHGMVLQTSLGYFIAPLMSVAMGVVLFGEPLRPARLAALLTAAAGVAVLALADDHPPWIALALGTTFSCYGLLRKTVAADSLIGLSVEGFLLLPIAAGVLAWWTFAGLGSFGQIDRATDLLLMAGALVTCGPLLCFGKAARLLPLSTLGFLQYLSPSIAFVLALTVFGETVSGAQMASFGLIWAALAAYTADTLLALRSAAPPPAAAASSVPTADPPGAKPPRPTIIAAAPGRVG